MSYIRFANQLVNLERYDRIYIKPDITYSTTYRVYIEHFQHKLWENFDTEKEANKRLDKLEQILKGR